MTHLVFDIILFCLVLYVRSLVDFGLSPECVFVSLTCAQIVVTFVSYFQNGIQGVFGTALGFLMYLGALQLLGTFL